MLMPNRHYPHLSYQVITDVAQVIDNHLRNEWVIRIEYTDEIQYLNTSWQQWGKPFYKVKTLDEVMDSLFACHVNNQLCSIRLYAEKFNPSSRFYYSVCQASQTSKASQYTSQETANIIPISKNRKAPNIDDK